MKANITVDIPKKQLDEFSSARIKSLESEVKRLKAKLERRDKAQAEIKRHIKEFYEVRKGLRSQCQTLVELFEWNGFADFPDYS